MTALLQLESVSRNFGGLRAVVDLDLAVGPDDCVGLIGPNGAGKSTAINLISGSLSPSHGNVIFGGRDVTSWPVWRRARIGVARTFQANRLLPGRTVEEHLRLAMRAASGVTLTSALRSALPQRHRREIALPEGLAEIGLLDMLHERADQLSFGHQRLLGIAMSVCACVERPALLLLDEPVAGMNQVEVDATLRIIAALRRSGFAILLVEHNMSAVMRAVERVVVLNLGQKLAEGTPQEISRDSAVITAYLGKSAEVLHGA